MHHAMSMDSPAVPAGGGLALGRCRNAKQGYDLDYIWKQVDRGPAKDAAGYYIQASETGGEPPGRWWGPGAKALGFEPGQTVERQPYDLLFGKCPVQVKVARTPLSELGSQGEPGRPGGLASRFRLQFRRSLPGPGLARTPPLATAR